MVCTYWLQTKDFVMRLEWTVITAFQLFLHFPYIWTSATNLENTNSDHATGLSVMWKTSVARIAYCRDYIFDIF